MALECRVAQALARHFLAGHDIVEYTTPRNSLRNPMHASVRAYIGLGANLGDALGTLRSAIVRLGNVRDCTVHAHSSVYRSAPVGYADQPDFLNAVVAIDTLLSPAELLETLLEIEHEFGRERSFRNAPRTLDMDILLYGEARIDAPGLQVPHPRMHERAFVLRPLAEIAPDVVIPGRGSATALLPAVADQPIGLEAAA